MRPSELAREVLQAHYEPLGIRHPEEAGAEYLQTRVQVPPRGRSLRWSIVDHIEELLGQWFFDLEGLIELEHRIVVDVDPLHSQNAAAEAPVHGLAVPHERRIVVTPEAMSYQPLCRMTLAHELGHVLMKHVGSAQGLPRFSPHSPNRSVQERQANAFMRAMLIPPNLIKLAVLVAASKADLNLSALLLSAHTGRVRGEWQRFVLPYLIERLCLSRQALCIHFEKIKVFTKADTDHHLSYSAPNAWNPRPCWRRSAAGGEIASLVQVAAAVG